MVFKLGVGHLGQRGLRAEGDAKTRLLDHELVVGAVAHGENILWAQAELIPGFNQRIALGDCINNRIADLPTQLPTGENEPVGADPVEADGFGDWVRKGEEATRDEESTGTARAHGLNESLGAFGDLHPLIETAAEGLLIKTRE